jgi:hypothetical protein
MGCEAVKKKPGVRSQNKYLKNNKARENSRHFEIKPMREEY